MSVSRSSLGSSLSDISASMIILAQAQAQGCRIPSLSRFGSFTSLLSGPTSKHHALHTIRQLVVGEQTSFLGISLATLALRTT